ncbi:MAG TPA: VanW family protein [Patescibacteria group bacterium]|nr:VanW family protein [Patescibacteria group bacterium]
MFNIFFTYIIALFVLMKGNHPVVDPGHILAQREFSLTDRYNNKFVNDVFKDNILLTINYLTGVEKPTTKVNWTNVNKPFTYKMVLKPGETFAFHDDVLPQYEGKVTKTSNAHFNAQEGFKSDGYLFGDGVCHLASLLYWTAKDAGLNTLAPTRHDFAKIPDVPEQFGVSIYDTPGKNNGDEQQNLYITNNKPATVAFEFNYDGHDLKIKAVEEKEDKLTYLPNE